MPMHHGQRRKSKFRAPCMVRFTTYKENGVIRPCVYAICIYGGGQAGPEFGQDKTAVRAIIRKVASRCGCGRRVHYPRHFEGKPAAPAPRW